MMSTAPPFALSREQATRLQAYIQFYRQYAFSSLLPSVERNNTLRLLQLVQGKIIQILDQGPGRLQLILSCEERTMLKAVATDLLLLWSRQPESPERLTTLGDLAALKNGLQYYCG